MVEKIMGFIQLLETEEVNIKEDIKSIKQEIKKLNKLTNEYIDKEKVNNDLIVLEQYLQEKELEYKMCKGAIRRLNKVLLFE